MSNYPYIRAWGRMMGSFSYYIENKVAEAQRDGAPADATYKDTTTGKWRTFAGIQNPRTKALIAEYVEEMTHER